MKHPRPSAAAPSLRGLLAPVLVAALSGAAAAAMPWSDVRTSAPQPGGLLTLRVEAPQGPGLAHSFLHLDGTVQTTAPTPVLDGPSTLEALLPAPSGQRRHYGFRLVQDGEVDLLPVRLADGTAPSPGLLSLVADDPTGDEAFGRAHLDLVSCRVSVTSTHLHAALRNAGGGFPVSQSLTFFSYLFGLSNPAESDPAVVWALIQTLSSPGIIEPGLYRVEGTGLGDLTKIGDVAVQEFAAENTLLISCALDDLFGDPAFAAWYDPADPRIGVGAFTQRITLLGGTQEADRIVDARLHLAEVSRDPGPNTLPQLAGLEVSGPGPQAEAEVIYADAEGHCPVTAQLVLTDAGGVIGSYPLYPQALDYSGAVVYRSEAGLPPLVSGAWTGAEARFSDNLADVVTLSVMVTAVADPAAGVSAQLRLDGSPNPFTGQTVFSFELPAAGPVRLTVHDVAGRAVAVLADGERPAGRQALVWDGRDRRGDRQPAGVYFYRLQTRQGEAIRRITLLR